jgi:hypothetical protein
MFCGEIQRRGNVASRNIASLDKLNKLKPEETEMESPILFQYLPTVSLGCGKVGKV